MLEILELIGIGARLFNNERKLYYINQAKKYENIIIKVNDSDFYKKDMNAKALAERELQSDISKLRIEFLSEAKAL